jgi:hemoglobin
VDRDLRLALPVPGSGERAGRPIHVPPIDPAQIAPPSREIYGRMGEASIVRMMEDFYRELEGSSIRALFPADMVAASRKSAAFFVGLLGGPPLYHQRHGNPMMRARHMAFAITPRAREEWLGCFERVLAQAPERYGFPDEHLPGFRAFLRQFSLWMVNSEDDPRAADGPGQRRPDGVSP